MGALRTDGMLIAHLVMVGFISFFLVTGWRRMEDGALRAWRAVLVVGLGLTLAGVAGFVGPVSGPTLRIDQSSSHTRNGSACPCCSPIRWGPTTT